MHRRLRQKSLPSAFLVCVFHCRAAAAAAAARCQNSCDFDTLPNAFVPPASQSCRGLPNEKQGANASALSATHLPAPPPKTPARLISIKEEFRANQHVDQAKAARCVVDARDVPLSSSVFVVGRKPCIVKLFLRLVTAAMSQLARCD